MFRVAGVSVAAGLSVAATLQDVTAGGGECRTQRVTLPGSAKTWTVLGPDHCVLGPAEEFLEYLRVQGTSPNTVKSYARALALWWTYLAVFGLAWNELTLADVGGFLAWLRSGDGPQVVSLVPPPVLTPGQIEAICDACARFDPASREWTGQVRDRLLWLLLAGTGLRLGEALGLQHLDWHTGRGDTPFIEVVPRDHPHGVRVKGGRYRRVFISDELDRLYGEYLWQLCAAGADLEVPDMDTAPVFMNLAGGARFAPWRPESVYDLVGRLRRDLARQVPAAWTPHWMRHSHATALLLAGVPVHVVSRRLGAV